MPESPDVIARRVARRVIRVLHNMRDCLHSGEGSGLLSAWEEICVQVQFQHSFFWAAYDETAYGVVEQEVGRLPQSTVAALWLETSPGETWLSEREVEGETPPYCIDAVAEYLLGVVYNMAANWSNRRIRAYLERQCT